MVFCVGEFVVAAVCEEQLDFEDARIDIIEAARLIGKTLRSAVANAENNAELSSKDLKVKYAIVNAGTMLKRFRPKARGSAGRIRKRTSHLEVVLSDV